MMTWALFKKVTLQAWLWVKEHWQIPFLIIWTIAVHILTKRNTDAMLEVVEAKRDSYKKQVEVLRKSHNDEIIRRNNLSKKYEEALEEMEKQYEVEKRKLTEAQKNDIKEVVIKSKGNSDDIKKRIQEEFGFTLIE